MAARRLPTRRTVLAGLGLGLAAPYIPGAARSSAGAPPARPPRLFIMYIPHGVPWEHFDPVAPDGSLDFGANGIGGFSPLEPYRQSVSFLRGVAMANDARDHEAIRAALTGFPEGGTADSIDYTIARALGVTPHVLGACPYLPTEGFTEKSHLARHGGAWVRALESPVAAADQLFGPTSSAAGADAPLEAEAIALAQRQVARAAARVAGVPAEARKLAIHAEALENVAAERARPQTACAARPALPAVDALAGVDPLDERQFGHVLDAHLEAAAQGMVCGAARVVTLQTMYVRSDLDFGFPDGPGIAASHHLGLSHVVDPREPYARAQQWLIGRLATKLLAVLDQPDPLDPAHTVLDNSLVYVFSEISDGSTHTSDTETLPVGQLASLYTYLPQVLIGGAAGYLKPGGRVIQVAPNRPHTDVLATIAGAMGVKLTSLGGQAVSEIAELKA
jgi:hypothetical protein